MKCQHEWQQVVEVKVAASADAVFQNALIPQKKSWYCAKCNGYVMRIPKKVVKL